MRYMKHKARYGVVNNDIGLVTYESVEACIEQTKVCETNQVGNKKNWKGKDTNVPGQGEWLGHERGVTVDTVRSRITKGWPSGVTRMERSVASLDVPPPRSVRRRSVWSDQGDTVDMQRVWSGRLDTAWRRTSPQRSAQPPRVTIACNVTAASRVDSKPLFWRGAACAKLADLLVTSGYSVRVLSIFSAECRHESRISTTCVTIKDWQTPMMIDSIVGTIANSAFMRWACIKNTWGTARWEVGNTCGLVVKAPNDVMGFISGNGLVFAMNDFETGKTDALVANEWVRTQIESLAEA